jgi:hypothetical protein
MPGVKFSRRKIVDEGQMDEYFERRSKTKKRIRKAIEKELIGKLK